MEGECLSGRKDRKLDGEETTGEKIKREVNVRGGGEEREREKAKEKEEGDMSG